MEGKLVAVKAIGPDCVDDFNPFKHVCLSPSPKHPLPTPFYFGVLIETMYSCGHVEATATSECGQVPRAQLQSPSFLPRVPLDVQRKPV